MNNFFNDLKNEAQGARLSQGEKQRMRVRLYEAMRSPTLAVPDIVAQKVPSPFNSFQFFVRVRVMVPLAALLIVVMGSGTALAAQGALPGDPLYAVKINVNEAVQVALATTPQAKAQVNAQIATTRLQEAEDLAAAGTLTASTSAQLAQNFDQHAQAAQTITDSLQAQDPASAAQISAQLDSSLSAHTAILAQLGDDSNSTTTMQESRTLADNVRSHTRGGDNNSGAAVAVNAAQTLTMQTFSALAPQEASSSNEATSSVATSSAKKPAKNNNNQEVPLHLAAQASSTLSEAQDDFAAIEDSLDASTTAQINMQFALAAQLMQEGSTSLAAGDVGSATQSFTQALSLATRLDTYLQAGKKFNTKLLSPLFDTFDSQNNGGNGGDNSNNNNSDASSSDNSGGQNSNSFSGHSGGNHRF
ncbi:MAG: DUF5667 domain-containing protein [Chthoniobacterales bacterium]